VAEELVLHVNMIKCSYSELSKSISYEHLNCRLSSHWRCRKEGL